MHGPKRWPIAPRSLARIEPSRSALACIGSVEDNFWRGMAVALVPSFAIWGLLFYAAGWAAGWLDS